MISPQTKIVLSVGVAQTLAWGASYYLPAILAAPIAGELGFGSELVYAAFSLALIIYAILGPSAGRRIDQFGGRGVLAASSLIFALGLALLGLANSAAILFLAWVVIGVGMAMGLYEAAFATLTGIYGRKARGPITGITLIAGLASTVAWPLTALIEAEMGWRMACFFWAGAHVLICLPLYLFMVPKGMIYRPEMEPEEEAANLSAAPSAARRNMIILAFVFAIGWFTSTAMAAHLPALLREAGATASVAVLAAALIGPAQVLGRLLEYGFLQRYHPLLSARMACLAHPVGATFLFFGGGIMATPFTLLHGMGNGILTIAKGTLPLAIFGPQGYGFRQGILMVPARFGQAAAPLIFGLLLERYGLYALLLSSLLGILAFIGLMLISPMAKTAE